MSKKDKSRIQPPPPAEAEAPPAREPAPPEQTDALRAERDDLLARLQRVSADYVNYQKRVQRDVEQAREFANEDLMKALIAVLDDMERALAAARENHDAEDALLKGMQLVHDKALETLGKFGLQVIEAEGRRFDPERHLAMLQEPSAEAAPMTVLRELQKGYTLKGRTVRPSAVVVSKAPEEEGEARAEQAPAPPP